MSLRGASRCARARSSLTMLSSNEIAARPFWSAFSRKMSAKLGAKTARNPKSLKAQAACSRDEPQPKLRPVKSIEAPL